MRKLIDGLLYWLIKSVSFLISYGYFRLSIEGKENIPKDRPFIIVSNHASFFDPVAIIIATGIDIRWLARKEVYEKSYLKPVHRVYKTIVVNGAVDKALDAIEEGDIVGVFPEGTRTRDGRIKRIHPGAAIIALKTGYTIIPVGVRGSFEAFGVGRAFPKPHKVSIKVGDPFNFDKIDSALIDDDILEEKKHYIVDRIKELL